MSFATRLEQYVKSTDATLTEGVRSVYLQDALKEVIDILPEDRLIPYSHLMAVPDAGNLDASKYRILSLRNYSTKYPAQKLDTSREYATNSFYSRQTGIYGFTVKKGKLIISGDTLQASTAKETRLTIVDGVVTAAEFVISGAPATGVTYAFCYPVGLNGANEIDPPVFNFVSGTTIEILYGGRNIPANYVVNGYLASTEMFFCQYHVLATADTSVAGFNPKYEEAFIIRAAQKILNHLLALKYLSATTIVPTLPTAPTPPAALSAAYVPPNLSSVAEVLIGAMAAVPTFSVSMPAKPTVTFTETISAAPSAPSFTYTGPTHGTITTSLIADMAGAPALTQLNTYLVTQEDIALAMAELEKVKTQLQWVIKDVENAVETAKFNSSQTDELAKINAWNTFQKDTEEYKYKLELYAKEIERYSVAINKKVQENQSVIQTWIQESQNTLDPVRIQFEATMQGYLRAAEQLIEQARISSQRAVEIARQTNDFNTKVAMDTFVSAVQVYQANMERFREQVSVYNAEVQGKIMLYERNIAELFQELQALQARKTMLEEEFNKALARV